MDFAVVDLVASWTGTGLGITLIAGGFATPLQEDAHVCCLCWADGFTHWRRTSATALVTMMIEFTLRMQLRGLDIQTED